MTDIDVIAEMRNWLSDCMWADMEPEDFDALTDDQVRAGVARFYNGGTWQFMSDLG